MAFLNKIENYQETFYVVTKNNTKNENRENNNTWVSWFYSLNSWSDEA